MVIYRNGSLPGFPPETKRKVKSNSILHFWCSKCKLLFRSIYIYIYLYIYLQYMRLIVKNTEKWRLEDKPFFWNGALFRGLNGFLFSIRHLEAVTKPSLWNCIAKYVFPCGPWKLLDGLLFFGQKGEPKLNSNPRLPKDFLLQGCL